MRNRVISLVAVLAGSACSSGGESHTVTCGPGTELVDGTCVAIDASTSDAASSDSVPSTETATATDDGTPDVLASDVTDATADVASSSSDPCPSVAMAVNCSKTCGGASANCAKAECPATDPVITLALRITNSLPTVVRTPEKPGKFLPCECAIPSAGGSLYSLLVALDAGAGKLVKVTVGTGWRLASPTSTNPWCGEPGDNRRCRIVSGNSGVLITTDDPNAPSRNVLFEAASAGDKCP